MKIVVVARDLTKELEVKEHKLAEINDRANRVGDDLNQDQQAARLALTEAEKRQSIWQLPLKKRADAQRRIKQVQDRRRDSALRFAQERAALQHLDQS